MSKSFSSALSLVGGILLCFLFVQNTVAQVVPADASMKVTRVDQNMNPINGTQVQIFGVERDTTGVIGIRRIYSPLYTTNPTIFTTDLQNINNQLAASGKSYYSGVSLSVTDLPYYNEYLGACSGENCTPGGFYRMFGGMARSFCNGTVCTEAEDLGFGGNLFIKYVPSPDVCPAGKVPFPDVTSVPCFLRSTMKVGGGTELKLEATPNLVGSCSLKETYQQRSGNSYISYPVTPAVAGKLSVSSSGASIVANTSTNIAIGEDTLPNLLTCPTGYTAMCSISDAGSNLCGCYWPHIQTESWAPVKPFNFTCVDSVSTCSEGQYFCSAENICKTTGQTCGTTDWVDVPLVGTESFDINAEYRYKISSQTGGWLYAKEVSARNLVTNESYFGQIFYVSADNKKSYQYNGNFLDTVIQIQKRVLPPWTDVILTNADPFNTAYEYRFKMTVPGRPGVPAGDFWYYAKQVGAQSLVMDNGYGEITFVSAANKTAYLSQGTPTGITISKMERRALTWNDVPLGTTDAYDVSCDYRFKMNYPSSPQWRPGVPAGDFWHYPERASAQSLIANANGGYQTFSVFANNKAVFDFNGVNNNTVLQMQKLCNAPVSLSSTCGNPRAQVNFTPYTGIPAADQNSSTNAWDSITLGNKAVVAGGTFFDLTDGANAIDDGTIVSTGLQNFAVSRHNGYIEFLALGRRLSTYYGYYQGTIRFQNVQVDRVEPGLTTGTWADIGLEAVEGDTVTKVSDNEVSFKLAFANQGDGFRVYLKNPTPTECTCPTGQEKKPDPKSPVCIVRARVDGVQDTTVTLTGYGHLAGECTVAGIVPQAPQTPSPNLVVTAGQQRVGWAQSSPWTFQLDPLLTCPANTTKTACMFTYGAGPLGEITCGCYPNENTNTPKNLSCQTFTNPMVHGKPVHSRSGSPEQFCREQGYSQSATVGANESNFIGNLSKWNGSVWEINPDGLVINSVSCCKLEDKSSSICVNAGCAAGQYWCQAENMCKPAGQSCSAVTCNNNNTCEAGESCNCGDCTNGGNDDADKCGLSNGSQMVCTKDKDNSTTAAPFSSVTAQENFNIVNNKLAAKLSQYGNANISAGEFAPLDTELQMTQDSQLTYFPSFTKEEAWARVKVLLSIPASAQVLWFTSSIKYENDALGDNERYLYSYVIEEASGVRKQILFATEYLPSVSLGYRKVYLIGKDFPIPQTSSGPVQVGACCPAGKQWSSSTGQCVTKTVDECLEGQYYCHAELTCKPAGESCGTVTCNNNNVCDTNESCDCADCNDKVDHCGLSGAGEQLICTKDTAEKCYTDKFPYCLSACLDGYTRNASGQCEPNTTPPTTTGTPFTCQNRAQNTFETIEAKLAPYLSQPGNLNIAANEFGTAQVELEMTQDTRQDNASSFTKEESWARVRELLSLPSSVQVLWTQSSALYSHSAYGGSNRYVHSYVIRETNGSPRQITYATEYLPGYGWRKVYLINKVYPLVDQNGQCLGNNVINTNEDWIAYTTPYYIYLAKLPIIPNTAAGRTFYIYNPEKVISRASMTKEAFLADPITAIQNAPLVPVGNTPLISRHIFNLAQLQSENTTIQNTTIDNLDAFIENRYLCTQNQIGATSCHVNNNGVHAPGTGYNLGSDIYAPITDSDSNIGYIKAETLGTFTINDSTIFQTFSYPVKNAGYVKNDTASATKFCTERGFTSATIASSDSSGAQKMGWNGTAWIADNTGGSYIKSLTCSQGTPQNLTCQTYAGNVQVSGGYLSIQPQSTTQFCREKGFQEPHMVSQYTQDGSCRLWNGTSWFEDEACVAVSEIKCCNSGSTSSSTTSSSSTPTSEIQLGACCPPGSAWNSVENRCIPTTCGEGQFYCAAQKKCLAGGTTCDTTVCNNDGVCSGEESCQCGDCVNGGGDDRDKCSVIGGVQAMCSDDNLTDNKPGACCPAGKQWSSSTGQCVTKTVDECLEGQYYCHAELKCKPANEACGTVTCNNNGTCDLNESCDCADCNEKADHCGINGNNEQLICTKDTTVSTTTSEPQLGACCPPGSAWNSVENRCIPTTCGEGQFYCAAQKKCLAGGTTCDTTVCNNDGVCSGEESCQCGDCVNGGGDDRDKCSVIGGVQAMCSDDNLTDNKPGACCIPPKKWNSTTNTCVECSNTQAPSELKAGVDEPYITCTGNGDTTKTHFKYRITKQGTTDAPFVSEIFTVGTSVLHPTMTLGDYTVECFYGNATGVDTSTTATPHSCVKTMSVKSDAQGCSRVYPYKGSTLSDEMTSVSAFDASFRCGSRKPVVGAITNPYMFRVGTQSASYLAFDALISELFNGLTIGPVSTQTQNYNFDTGNTDVTCATKVGGGYSTNTACQLRTCVGGACNVPQTFSVVHSDDLICTTEETSTYNIGCNPAAPDSVRNQCIQWFRDAVNAGSRNVSNGVEFNVSFAFNADAPTNVTCIKYVAGQMPGGLNLSDNVVCRATLKNGERYQIYAADTNGRIDALQTTAKTVERDREAPTMAEIKYYTDDTLTTEVPSTNWYNKPVIALAVCSDTPLNEATSCACAQRVDTTTTDADAWSLGVPNSLIGADLMRYTRTITETLTGTQKVQVVDTAGNTSTAKNIAVSLDTQAPLVTPTESGAGTTRTITLTASDTGSKIWKTTGAPSGATNTSGIVYRVGPKADMATLAFDTACNTTAAYATVTETQSSSYPSQATATISNLNTATQVVAYCVRDNAGNTTRGMYPVTVDACFSATNMSTIPNFDTYKGLLKTRLTTTGNDNQKYGYSFSENTADASCFRGILSTNITTLITNQLKPRTSTTLSNWDRDRAELSTSTTLSNGYYYYVYPTSNTLNIVTSPSGGTPVKSVVVEGGDIRIKTDINYSGAGKTLLLIARKSSNGQGGNIIIDTNVKNIDAILIADGGSLRSSDATVPGERLTINGRLYSYNTRGGSLAVSGTDFIDSTTPKKFTNSSLVGASSLNDARIQDLERFRPIFADGNNACSLVVNHQVFTTANLPALLKRPSTFNGGSCGF